MLAACGTRHTLEAATEGVLRFTEHCWCLRSFQDTSPQIICFRVLLVPAESFRIPACSVFCLALEPRSIPDTSVADQRLGEVFDLHSQLRCGQLASGSIILPCFVVMGLLRGRFGLRRA